MKTLTTFIWGLILLSCGGVFLHLAFQPDRELWDKIFKGLLGFWSIWKAYDKIDKTTY